MEFPDGPLSAFFFGTRSRSPTDRPEHYRHANTARSLERVWLASDDAAIVAMLGRLGARLRPGRACLPRCGQVEMATLAAGEIVLLDRRRQRVPGRPIVGVTIGVTSLAATRRALRAGGVTAVASGRSLFVPPTAANGLWIEFREAGAQAASSAASSP